MTDTVSRGCLMYARAPFRQAFESLLVRRRNTACLSHPKDILLVHVATRSNGHRYGTRARCDELARLHLVVAMSRYLCWKDLRLHTTDKLVTTPHIGARRDRQERSHTCAVLQLGLLIGTVARTLKWSSRQRIHTMARLIGGSRGTNQPTHTFLCGFKPISL